MIDTDALTKQFKVKDRPPIVAVDGLTIHVREGEVFGFLGPNGAGKTTTVRMLCSLIGPTSGHARIDGHEVGKDDQAIRETVGILTESPGMYDRLSAERNLTIFARLYGVKDIAGQVEKYLRMLGLWERRFDEAGSFSKGMRQKLAIARALLHEPKVLFLDEPTSGLDPEAAKLVRDFIEELKSEGRTIFLCTHNLDEADRLCERIAIFKTYLITVDSPENLRKQLYGRKVVFHLACLDPAWVLTVRALPFVKEAQALDSKLVIGLDNPEEHNPALVRCLVELGADIQFVGELRHSLEDVYLQLIHAAAPEEVKA
ncbi:MAG: ABC transporter ATP-binding protein [Anaerolineaceae bacterium]|nr:ABC transporter ATP-binding protein [Anaerolineaceae bacterium]